MNPRFLLFFIGIMSISLLLCDDANCAKKRLLIGSPIRQKPAILHEFLQSLQEIDTDSFCADYFFIDDNTNPDSIQILYDFSAKNSNCLIAKPTQNPVANTLIDAYTCDENTHYWHDAIIWKVAGFKDFIINYALQNNYDYLFLIDSDIVLHPKTLDNLISTNKDIISNVFWTQWQPGYQKLPQVWYYDEYKQYLVMPGEKLKPEEILARQNQFLQLIATPGTYEVGGLGACTLINKKALEKGVNFKKIKNITFWGEDRHFCIRASALGIDLFVNTEYPAYHIYRETDLDGVSIFKENCLKNIYQM